MIGFVVASSATRLTMVDIETRPHHPPLSAQGIIIPRLDGLAAFAQAFAAGDFVVSTDLRAVFVVLAKSSRVIKPQAAVLRFLPAQQAREVQVDFVNQVLRQVGGAKRVRVGVVGTRRVQHDGRSDAEAADSTAFA